MKFWRREILLSQGIKNYAKCYFIAVLTFFRSTVLCLNIARSLCNGTKEMIRFFQSIRPVRLSNSLIIHAALTQPEHLILVRWMGLETQWKRSWKHGRVWKPVFETISNTDANFLNLHIDKATKTLGDKQLYLITHFLKQTLNLNYLLLTLNVMEQFLKNPKQKRPFFF